MLQQLMRRRETAHGRTWEYCYSAISSQAYDNTYFALTEAARGLVTGGSSKGYIYTSTVPSPVVRTLDEFPKAANYDVRLYEHLTGKWYIFLERGG
jgi:hypothetical protein